MLNVAVTFSLAFPLLVLSHQCDIDPNYLSSQDAFIKCVPDVRSNKTDPSTVCISTCKANNLRFKHRCNRNGKWDITPGSKKCEEVVACPRPWDRWPHWDWKCVGLTQGSKCYGSCKLDNQTTVEISCQKNTFWSPIENLDEPDTCPRRGKLMIVGGINGTNDDTINSIEIIDLDNEKSTCTTVNTTYPKKASNIKAGAVMSSSGKTAGFLFCGGWNNRFHNDCYTYFSNGFGDPLTTIQEAIDAAATMIPYNLLFGGPYLWITGGTKNGMIQNTTQLVGLNGSVIKGPEMPDVNWISQTTSIFEHCSHSHVF